LERQQYADYPGIVPYTKSEKLFNRELDREEKSVRGILVAGLTAKDVARLDHFEGSVSYCYIFFTTKFSSIIFKEYDREEVSVHPLEDFRDISAAQSVDEETLPEHAPSLPLPKKLRSPSLAQTYIYRDEKDLQAKLWSYEDFVRENARKWY